VNRRSSPFSLYQEGKLYNGKSQGKAKKKGEKQQKENQLLGVSDLQVCQRIFDLENQLPIHGMKNLSVNVVSRLTLMMCWPLNILHDCVRILYLGCRRAMASSL
jgi:hypothetical protein